MMLNAISENVLTIDSFLTEEECQNFILQAEKIGFTFADVNTGSRRELLTNIRNNERVDYTSPELAEQWWQKLSSDKLPAIEGMKAVGVSPYFRFYKYSPDQKFNMHKDGRQNIDGNTTMFTLLVYLNQDYVGGNTKFRQDDLSISAEAGKALIFEHHLWHQGDKILQGTKYVLRSDIVYAA